MRYFECYGMMMIIQGDMDDLSVGDEYRLAEISGFDPYAVLEYVDRVAKFADDAADVRRRWYALMFRSGEIVRRYRHDVVECFVDRKRDFSKQFVLAVIGLMKKEYGLYRGRYEDMAEALERAEDARMRADRYMKGLLGDMRVLPSSVKVIREVVG